MGERAWKDAMHQYKVDSLLPHRSKDWSIRMFLKLQARVLVLPRISALQSPPEINPTPICSPQNHRLWRVPQLASQIPAMLASMGFDSPRPPWSLLIHRRNRTPSMQRQLRLATNLPSLEYRLDFWSLHANRLGSLACLDR